MRESGRGVCPGQRGAERGVWNSPDLGEPKTGGRSGPGLRIPGSTARGRGAGRRSLAGLSWAPGLRPPELRDPGKAEARGADWRRLRVSFWSRDQGPPIARLRGLEERGSLPQRGRGQRSQTWEEGPAAGVKGQGSGPRSP